MSVNFDSPIAIRMLDNPSLFQPISHDKAKRETIFRLNVKKLSKDDCYLFWDYSKHRTFLVLTALEFISFNPLNKKINDKFRLSSIYCNNYHFFMVAFPKEYKDICIRAAKTFQMRIVNASMKMTDVQEMDSVPDVPSLTLAEDYKSRRIPGRDDIEREKPVPKDALAIPVKKQLETTILEFPKSDSILWVKGGSLGKREFLKKQWEIMLIGNALEELGID